MAVYLCCTFPRVAPGGCYPLSLPYGARTFLIDGPFAPPTRLSSLLARVFYKKRCWMSNILEYEIHFTFRAIYVIIKKMNIYFRGLIRAKALLRLNKIIRLES